MDNLCEGCRKYEASVCIVIGFGVFERKMRACVSCWSSRERTNNPNGPDAINYVEYIEPPAKKRKKRR